MGVLKNLLSKVEEDVSIVVFLIMLALTFFNVVGRYCFHAAISFTDEVTTNLFVLTSVIGTAIAAKDRAHLGLSAFTELLPHRVQLIISGIANVLGAFYGIILLLTGVQMVQHQMLINAKSSMLMIPAWVYGIFLPIGAIFIIIRFCEAGIEDFKKIKN